MMAALYVIEERDRHWVGLARSGLSKSEAKREALHNALRRAVAS